MPTPRVSTVPQFKYKARNAAPKARAKKNNRVYRRFRPSHNRSSKLLELAARAVECFTVTNPCVPRVPGDNPRDSSLVHLPTNTQSAEAKEGIPKIQEALAILDLECEELERKLADARLRHSQLGKKLFVQQALMRVIHKLPYDILTMFFKVHVLENKQSPWVLMHVNKAWRAAALSTPTVFSGIEITTIKWNLEGYPRHRDGREICGTLEQFLRAIIRAEGVPLDLKFSSDRPDSEKWSDMERKQLDDIMHFLDAFRDELTIGSFETSGCFPPMAYCVLSPSSFRSITIGPGSIPIDIFDMWASTAKNLRSLEFDHFMIMFCDPKQVWWSNLEHLKMYNTSELFSYPEACRIDDILEATRSLRSLELDLCFPNPVDHLHIRRYPFLERLCLYGLDGMHNIDAPLLKYLKMKASRFWGTSPLELPRLSYLEITFFGHNWRQIVAPNLHTLVIGDNQARAENEAFLEKLWPKGQEDGESSNHLDPVVLRCYKMPISARLLASRLRTLTRLEELHLEEMDFLAALVDSLAPRKSGVPCPRLRAMKIVFKPKVRIKKSISSIQTMLKARARAGFPLQDVKLGLAESDEWLNLLL